MPARLAAACVSMHDIFFATKDYGHDIFKPLVGISWNLQLRCVG